MKSGNNQKNLLMVLKSDYHFSSLMLYFSLWYKLRLDKEHSADTQTGKRRNT